MHDDMARELELELVGAEGHCLFARRVWRAPKSADHQQWKSLERFVSRAIAFIFIGRFSFNLVQSVSTFAVLIVTCTSPWMVIMILGLIVRRGVYHADDLQVFTRGERGGRYWFQHGWNWRGLGAWIPSAAVGLCFVNLPGQFVGALGDLAGGIDISLPITLGMAGLLYLALLNLFPEPAEVYGPLGPRWVRQKSPVGLTLGGAGIA